jgi:hypothetical protein
VALAGILLVKWGRHMDLNIFFVGYQWFGENDFKIGRCLIADSKKRYRGLDELRKQVRCGSHIYEQYIH